MWLDVLDNFRGRPERGVVHVAEHALRVVRVRRVDRALVLPRYRSIPQIKEQVCKGQKREAYRYLEADRAGEGFHFVERELDGRVVRRVVLPVPQ